jgi:hypothetical protein
LPHAAVRDSPGDGAVRRLGGGAAGARMAFRGKASVARTVGVAMARVSKIGSVVAEKIVRVAAGATHAARRSSRMSSTVEKQSGHSWMAATLDHPYASVLGRCRVLPRSASTLHFPDPTAAKYRNTKQ